MINENSVYAVDTQSGGAVSGTGGGIYAQGGTLDIRGSTVTGNTIYAVTTGTSGASSGAGISSFETPITVTGSTFQYNALNTVSYGTFAIQGSVFSTAGGSLIGRQQHDPEEHARRLGRFLSHRGHRDHQQQTVDTKKIRGPSPSDPGPQHAVIPIALIIGKIECRVIASRSRPGGDGRCQSNRPAARVRTVRHREGIMAGGMSRIANLVVVMMENRSFDNLLGWLYGPGNPPAQVIGGQAGDPSFFGLTPGSYWNPANASFFQGATAEKVFATEGTTGSSPFTVPDPDPLEAFDDISFQIFGTTSPLPSQAATMLGFLVNYQKTSSTNPSALMETYSPDQLTVLSGLARNYAVSDAWYASAPCQTWPNRAFVHTGTSNGRVNNWPNNPFDFDIPTIFNVLEANRNTWAVYNPGPFSSLTRLQLPRLYDPRLNAHFLGITDFIEQAKAGTLPSYSFVEPSFLAVPQAPTTSTRRTMSAWASSSCWRSIPPWSAARTGSKRCWSSRMTSTAAAPTTCRRPGGPSLPTASDPGEEGFHFDRFGVRVPLVLVSPWVQAGTVFRSTTNVPYDHTSILATLRDWLAIPESLMLQSRRIAVAPTLGEVLNLGSVRQDRPTITSTCTPSPSRLSALERPNIFSSAWPRRWSTSWPARKWPTPLSERCYRPCAAARTRPDS